MLLNFIRNSYVNEDSFHKNYYFTLTTNLHRNILEKSITEDALVNINTKPDFSPAPSILGSHLPFPLMSLLLASRECIMQVTSKHFWQIPPKTTQDGILNV